MIEVLVVLGIGGVTGGLVAVCTYDPSSNERPWARVAAGAAFAVACGSLTAQLCGLDKGNKDGDVYINALMPIGFLFGLVGWYLSVFIQRVLEHLIVAKDPLREIQRILKLVLSRGKDDIGKPEEEYPKNGQ